MQALQFLSDPNKVKTTHLYDINTGCASLFAAEGKIEICSFEEGAFDGYRSYRVLETIPDYDVVDGYRFVKGGYGEITAYPPHEQIGLRIDKAILPKWLQTLQCDCMHCNPESDDTLCELKDNAFSFSLITMFLTTNTTTKKTHLIALIPDNLSSCKVMAYSEKNPD